MLIGVEIGRQVAGKSVPVILVGKEGMGAFYTQELSRSGAAYDAAMLG